ncbi:hypothetical protein SAMN04488564_104372 [Lentzea waywayandensis]|uniref:Uncharacterized protein n=1 Tax=Lentzea waywayandensis TaxID=84724 RepID=A0A1I6EFI5_9PSEU|nr:hypothetical protein [Lentzea waywayandensis]SFR16417.1 hypothetical protein SAMN04488564_104372 [Lentzea waywayandensis]
MSRLVLFLAANPNPITLTVTDETRDDLASRLTQIVRNGHTQPIAAPDGREYVVNFSNVVVAHFE